MFTRRENRARRFHAEAQYAADRNARAEKVLAQLQRSRVVEFWGQKYRVRPRLLNELLGDGKKLIWFEFMDHRPSYYILRVDSQWDMDNSGSTPFCDHLSEVYFALENQFGRSRDEDDPEDVHREFPAVPDEPTGSAWGEFFDVQPWNS